MMHLFGLVLFLLFLANGARRSIRIDDSRIDAQRQDNALANHLEVSAVARQALIPGGTRNHIFRRAGLRAGALPERSKQDAWRAGYFEPQRSAPLFRFGSGRAKVALRAATGPKEDQFASRAPALLNRRSVALSAAAALSLPLWAAVADDAAPEAPLDAAGAPYAPPPDAAGATQAESRDAVDAPYAPPNGVSEATQDSPPGAIQTAPPNAADAPYAPPPDAAGATQAESREAADAPYAPPNGVSGATQESPPGALQAAPRDAADAPYAPPNEAVGATEAAPPDLTGENCEPACIRECDGVAPGNLDYCKEQCKSFCDSQGPTGTDANLTPEQKQLSTNNGLFGDSGISYSKAVEDLFATAFGAKRQNQNVNEADVGGFADDIFNAAKKAISVEDLFANPFGAKKQNQPVNEADSGGFAADIVNAAKNAILGR